MNNIRQCRNSDLWEAVSGFDECFCVCYSEEIYDAESDKSVCKCHEDRISTDICLSKSCTDEELAHRF